MDSQNKPKQKPAPRRSPKPKPNKAPRRNVKKGLRVPPPPPSKE